MLIYAPIEGIESRYTKHLDRDIMNYLNENNIEYVRLEPNVITDDEIKNGSFLDADNTIYRQFNQFNQLITLLRNGDIPKGSTLFITDIWNIGVLAIPYLNFFGEYDIKVKGVLHAGSFTDTDFVRQMERYYAGIENVIFDICETIYVGSQFIKDDLCKKRVIDPNKIIVTGLPLDETNLNEHRKWNHLPTIIFNGRNVDEKQPYLFELLKEKLPQYHYVNTQKSNLSKKDYYQLLSMSKCVVSFALQENFGYGIQEAVKLGCIPILPNRLVYPEQFDKQYLYDTFEECVNKVELAMEGNIPPPILKNEYTNKEIFNTWFI